MVEKTKIKKLKSNTKTPTLFKVDEATTLNEIISEDEKPPLETTTLWDYPKQSYGKTSKGNNKFQGVTPAFIIYNLITRYTQPDDLVVDPMAGSGTTIDVCKEEGRKSSQEKERRGESQRGKG